jgi:hypothetical protein
MTESGVALVTALKTKRTESEVLVAQKKKTMLLANFFCLPMVLLIFPLQFSPQGTATESSFASQSAFRIFSTAECANQMRNEAETGSLAPFAGGSAPQQGCADPIDKCKKPIKYLGSKGDCACFACEYGKATQHNICTQNKKDKETLLAESGE